MTTHILGLDPGTAQSALVAFDGQRVQYRDTLPNGDLLTALRHFGLLPDEVRVWPPPQPPDGKILVVEQIAAMGMAVGAEVFETCMWSGRFIEAWDNRGGRWDRLKRVPIKVHLCGTAKAKDPNVRRALMDRFGGDASVKKGGALYGVKGDEWAALAVAVTYDDLRRAQHGLGPIEALS